MGAQQGHEHYAMSPVTITHIDGHLGPNQTQTLPPMSSFRGNTSQTVTTGTPSQNSPVIYNHSMANHQHAQHSPAIQNDTLVGKALQTVSSTQ